MEVKLWREIMLDFTPILRCTLKSTLINVFLHSQKVILRFMVGLHRAKKEAYFRALLKAQHSQI